MRLAQRLAARIRAEGPLRFDAFQEAALYDPESGYYERAGRVGRSGDFVTGPSWHPAFGRTIARIARRLREEGKREGEISLKVEEVAPRGLRAPTDVVDVGAGEGELLAAAGEALRAWGVRDDFRLVGVERSATRQAVAQGRCPNASWLSSLGEIRTFSLTGVVVCYELFDALPVRALFFEGEKLLERVVTLGPDGEGFAWAVAECPDAEEVARAVPREGHSPSKKSAPRGARRRGRSCRGPGLASLFRPDSRLRLWRPGSCALLGRTPERDARGFRVARRHTRRPEGSRFARPDGVGRLFGGRGRLHGRRALGRAFGEPVARSRRGRDLRRAHRRRLGAARRVAPSPIRRTAAALVQPGGMGESIRVLIASRGTALGSALTSWRHPA